MNLQLILLTGTGSFLGGISRYFLSLIIGSKSGFPINTLIINISGCFLIGLVLGFAEKLDFSNEIKLFLATGFLGGFTTFSAFSNETFLLLKNGQYSFAAVYMLLSVLTGLLATGLGYFFVRNA
ncbi:MAG: fluoride efflux transporter CrcB [Prevotellaceae bacterium]|jgi:CrcB protein|nr:fluoride efflux transporter CrcB [Prevotellaceae bacterium]